MKDATLAQGNQVLNLILQKKVSSEVVQQLLESGLLSDLLETDLTKLERKDFRRFIQPPVQKVFQVEMDYWRPLSELMMAGDKDHFVMDTIYKYPFASVKRENGKKEMRLVQVCWAMPHLEVTPELKNLGLRPAEFLELLTFVKQYPQYPNEQVQSIIALGASMPSNLVEYTWSPMAFLSQKKKVPFSAIDNGECLAWKPFWYLAVKD